MRRREWRIVYRRSNGAHEQVRIFQTHYGADRFLMKLLADGRPDLAPLVELRVEQRACDPWEITGRVIGGES